MELVYRRARARVYVWQDLRCQLRVLDEVLPRQAFELGGSNPKREAVHGVVWCGVVWCGVCVRVRVRAWW